MDDRGKLKEFRVVLYGTITRDIRHMTVDAATEDEARNICATEMPSYRLHSIQEAPND